MSSEAELQEGFQAFLSGEKGALLTLMPNITHVPTAAYFSSSPKRPELCARDRPGRAHLLKEPMMWKLAASWRYMHGAYSA